MSTASLIKWVYGKYCLRTSGISVWSVEDKPRHGIRVTYLHASAPSLYKQLYLDAASSKLRLRSKNTFDLDMTLTCDIWPWERFQQCTFTLRILMPNFNEIRPVNTVISHHTRWRWQTADNNARTDRRTTRKHKPLAAYTACPNICQTGTLEQLAFVAGIVTLSRQNHDFAHSHHKIKSYT